MNQIPITIFDLLLGKTSFPVGQPVLEQQNTEGKAPFVFGELFGSLLSDINDKGMSDNQVIGETETEPNNVSINSGIDDSQNLSRISSINKDVPNLGVVTENDLINYKNDNLTSINSDFIAGNDDDVLVHYVSEKTPDNVEAFNSNLKEILPDFKPIYTQNIQNIINNVPVDLEPGMYEIIDAQINNKNLTLEVVSGDGLSESVKINIPIETLKNNLEQNNIQNTNQRLSVDALKYDNQQMTDMLKRLNFKELNISSTNNAVTLTESGKTIDLNLTAEVSGSEVVLKSQLKGSKLTGYVRNNDVLSNEEVTNTKLSETGITQNKKEDINTVKNQTVDFKADVKQAVNKAAVADDSNVWKMNDNYTYQSDKTFSGKDKILFNNEKVFNNLEQLLESDKIFDQKSISTKTNNKIDSFFNLEKGTAKIDISAEKLTTHPVRFNLPDNLNNVLKPNGQSIMIRIEPDHLGPAQIKLTIDNEKLKAQVKVHSAMAKATLENSLDKLMQQLSKADIKVDFIEITADGENTDNQLFQRQPHWNKRFRANRLADDGSTKIENNISITPQMQSNGSVSSSGGVNLLA